MSMYGGLAEYYDLIYHWKDYAAEAARLRAIFAGRGIADGARVLDVACGTGSHLHHMQGWYRVSGRDLSPEMLAVARRRLPAIELAVADMAALRVDRPVDALLCLFSAFGYLLEDAAIDGAIARFAAALRPGGVLVLEPWVDPEHFRAGTPAMHTYESPDLKLCRMIVTGREGDVSRLTFHWLIAASGSPGVVHEVEEHLLRLVPHAVLRDKLAKAGFLSVADERGLTDDRGLIVAVRG